MATCNFLSQFQNDHPHHIVDFIKIWYNYDTDRNGYIDTTELFNFVRDYLQLDEPGKKMSDEEINEVVDKFILLFDQNKDGKIVLNEFLGIVPKENNFLLQFRDGITDESFETIFTHYDQDNNGTIEGPELIGLLRDLKESTDNENTPLTTTELELYRDQIIEILDTNGDGKLQRQELKMLFLG